MMLLQNLKDEYDKVQIKYGAKELTALLSYWKLDNEYKKVIEDIKLVKINILGQVKEDFIKI